MKGKLIVFEGIDGSGKSTQAKEVTKYLNKLNIKTIYTFEPTKGQYGEKLRSSYFTKRFAPEKELMLFVKDRKEHTKYFIKPHLEEGVTVISDRYFYSSVAYQGALGIDTDYIISLHKNFIVEPDLIFIFEIDIETGLRRINAKRDKTDEFENYNYLKKVDAIFKSFKFENIERINADVNKNILTENIIKIIRKRFNF